MFLFIFYYFMSLKLQEDKKSSQYIFIIDTRSIMLRDILKENTLLRFECNTCTL